MQFTNVGTRRVGVASGITLALFAGVALAAAPAAFADEVEYYSTSPTGVLHTTLDTAGVVPSTTYAPPAPDQAPTASFDNEYGLDDDAVACGEMVAGIWRVTNIGGYATSGHVSGSDHYTGNAIDIMLTPVNEANLELGWEIAEWLVEYADELNIKYIIFNGMKWDADQGWQEYSHPSGSNDDTAAHNDHIHVSFY